MAEGDGAVYNVFKFRVLNGTYNLANGGDAIHITLHTGYTPNIDTHAVRADVVGTEYGSGAGYTADGKVLTGQSTTQDNTDNEGVYDANDPIWTALGPLTPSTPSHAIMWDNTPSSPVVDPLIGYWELGTTPTNGSDYRLQFAAEGVLNLA